MSGNPYSTILGLTKSEPLQDNVMVGEVRSISPLIIQLGELSIYNDDMLMADYLLPGYNRDYSMGSNSSGNIRYTDGFNIGDKLAVLQTADTQLYIIVARLKEV